MSFSALHLGPLDSAILAAYMVLLAAIGVWAARRPQKTTDDYFLAGRSIPWLVTVASFFATCISALTFIGQPAEGYAGDFRFLFSNAGDIAATIFIAFVFIPHFQKLRLTSIYEAVSLRFGPSMRTCSSAYFLVTRTLASTVRIVAAVKVLEVVSAGALSYPACVFIVVGTVLIYTTSGGGRAVAWTDLMQFFLLVGGAFVALAYLLTHIPGGFSTVIEIGRHAVKSDGTVYNKFNFLDFWRRPEDLGLIVLMSIWGFFNSSAAYGTDQDMVQRLLACEDPKKARWTLLIWGAAGIPITLLFLFIGACLYAYAHFHPDFIAGMGDPDHVFPRFILAELPHGLRGLLLAAVAAAAMGSADSALASLSTAWTMDFYRTYWGKGASQKELVRASRFSFVAFGMVFILLALALRRLDRILWLAFRVTAFTYGPLLGIFSVAILTDWKVQGRKLMVLMLSTSSFFFALAMTAWAKYIPGAHDFWSALHQTYWPLYVVFAALMMPAGAYLLREP